ncbi:hypothetical protein DFH06DRAFT_1217748 [Mycena polygramma]|nr:hypothetical protein DFH06DRAFT_1217748 [Mycena polygramma]
MANIPDCTTLSAQVILARTLGPMVMGIQFQSILSGMLFALVARYYYCTFKDRASYLYKYALVGLIVLNAFECGIDFDAVYRTVVTHHGNCNLFEVQTWTTWAEPGVTATILFLVQLFLLEPSYHAAKKSWSILAGLMFVIGLIAFGSGLAVMATLVQLGQPGNKSIPMALWIISTAAANIAVTVSQVSEVLKKTMFKRPTGAVKKIIQLVETNGITTIFAVLNLILYFAVKGTDHLLLQYSLARVGTITVFTMLLQREESASNGHNSFSLTGKLQERVPVDELRVKVDTVVERDHEVPDGSIETQTRCENKTAMWSNV